MASLVPPRIPKERFEPNATWAFAANDTKPAFFGEPNPLFLTPEANTLAQARDLVPKSLAGPLVGSSTTPIPQESMRHGRALPRSHAAKKSPAMKNTELFEPFSPTG
jgi:hypothetical protein